ncbi:hypothetical protein GOP47_0011654 [Adiantum capillus-veneris]|uniref:Uncharacterized protein n=1 Tax=Adiantum capillus-veneris TaxID=13818 RepID=A0A9D4UTB9_ADICA|nr:hypothetical protein GOP47_0011654 [Adiantum capillus-veneris]
MIVAELRCASAKTALIPSVSAIVVSQFIEVVKGGGRTLQSFPACTESICQRINKDQMTLKEVKNCSNGVHERNPNSGRPKHTTGG